MSMTVAVAVALNSPAVADIAAAKIAAMMSPTSPCGKRVVAKVGKT
jgi:hypothetical protein